MVCTVLFSVRVMLLCQLLPSAATKVAAEGVPADERDQEARWMGFTPLCEGFTLATTNTEAHWRGASLS